MSDPKRKPWSEESNRSLIAYWHDVGSIVLIAMLLERSPSSVQTQASRLGLPRRAEGKDRHRRRWTDEDDSALAKAVDDCTQPDGRILIGEVAARMERSVDAIAARLVTGYDDEQTFLSQIVIPRADAIRDRAADRSRESMSGRASKCAAGKDTRKEGRTRECLSCEKPFWSEGAHNRVCNKCKRDDGGWEW